MSEIAAVAGNVLQDDADFRVEVVPWEDGVAVHKQAKPDADSVRVERIENDVYGMGYFADIAANHPDFALYVPELFAHDDRGYTTEYIASAPVLTLEQSPAEAAPRMRRLAGLLAQIDSIEPYGETRYVGSSDYHDIRKNFAKWLVLPLEAGQVTESDMVRIHQVIDRAEPHLQPRIAHGDMSPLKHAYLREDGKIALIDFEIFTPSAARYYDVAWGYTRTYARAADPSIARRFLADFLELAEDVPHRAEQVLAVIAQRTVGLQHDVLVDPGQYVNAAERAKELMSIVGEGRLERLL